MLPPVANRGTLVSNIRNQVRIKPRPELLPLHANHEQRSKHPLRAESEFSRMRKQRSIAQHDSPL